MFHSDSGGGKVGKSCKSEAIGGGMGALMIGCGIGALVIVSDAIGGGIDA